MSTDDQGIAALTPPADHHSGAGSPVDYSSPQYFHSPAAESARRPSNGRSKSSCDLYLYLRPATAHSYDSCIGPPTSKASLRRMMGAQLARSCWCCAGFCIPLTRSVPYIIRVCTDRWLTLQSSRPDACLMRSNLFRHRCHDVFHI